ncbi:gamma-glutamyltransferase family protein [Lederbergia citrea]|uniref:gamma-glutamyltransferase family protein n=1 Tax=Lederbergia citrea TaxID=2833581 RepID=UPI001BC91FA6|nr:gamma-glutamyltransferase family protein [Lederbergia citrea]MBS4178305.1 gamma-glutamyltransferase family protein [Lederbergia citrea]
MKTDHLYYPYASQRMTVHAQKGMVSTTQPLAAQAGLRIMQKGGNAIDAAIAASACLTVVEPNSTSIGGDSFALVWAKGELHGLNASGPAPQSISIDKVKELGHDHMPSQGVLPITVPGTPASWAALSKRFGKLPLTEVLQPAIEYARDGFPVSPEIGRFWDIRYHENKNQFKGEEFKEWFNIYAPNGRAPKIGEMWRSPDHARTLQAIAETDGESFYRGEIAEKIAACVGKYNGFLSKEDLAAYQPEWVQPISVNYKGYDIWEIPPNGQGIVALMALQMLKAFDFTDKEAVDTYHKQIEAVKLAYVDGLKYITDPKNMKVTEKELLSEKYADLRRELITDEAILPDPGEPIPGGTAYLATADQEGNMVSFIQSHAGDFGSGVVVPDTGVCLLNRGSGFSLDPDHHNALAGGKKTLHTIIPGFITKDNEPVGPFGVMCGMIQPQAHVQVVMNMVDFMLNPQATLDAPRWRWVKEKLIEVEPQFPDHIAKALVRKGHIVQRAVESGMFGRGQIIVRDPKTGILSGGTEPRADGSIAVW